MRSYSLENRYNAEIYQLTTGETQKAQTQLEKAETYLKQAESHVKEAVKPKLAAIEKAVQAAKADIHKQDPAVRERYETLKADLLYLVRRVYLTT